MSSLIDYVLLTVAEFVPGLFLTSVDQLLLGLAISLAYFTYFHGRTGRTPGNAALSIRVVDIDADVTRPIGYGRAARRWLVSIVSGIVLLLGYLWMLWDPRKQTWHDKAAQSLPIVV